MMTRTPMPTAAQKQLRPRPRLMTKFASMTTAMMRVTRRPLRKSRRCRKLYAQEGQQEQGGLRMLALALPWSRRSAS
eukprot:6208275-Pleurochrysis_carterae.AAC.1